ncbi:MAG: PA14 domain-containing protein [Phycisphaeraceae bacterium]
MRQYPFALLGLFAVALYCALPILAADEPDTGGLEIEEGLRLRIYWIGSGFDTSRALQPGQSPNVDVTVPGVLVTKDTVFQDKQAVDEATEEKIAEAYIAQWTGWIKAPKAGEYRFERNEQSGSLLTVGGEMVLDNTMQLDAGWHTIELKQAVSRKRDKPIKLRWSMPGEDVFADIAIDHLRAPKFFFRPTQRGKKQLVEAKTRPGLGKKVVGVHPGYTVTNIRPGGMDMPVGGLGMLSDGRLVVARFDAQTLKAPSPTVEPNGELWLLTNPTAENPKDVKGELIAAGLFEPSGAYVIDDAIYVSQRSELSKFVFNELSNKWDKSVIASGWNTNDFHQISAGLPWIAGPTPDHPGFFYMSRGAGLGKGQNPVNHASVWKIDLSKPDGENVEVLTGGHRTPNGLGLNTAGDCFVIDNQGGWTPANEINHVQKGKFYGYYLRDNPPNAHAAPFQPEARDGKTGVTRAAIQLPQDEIGNSPTELLLFPKDHIFEGQMALGDMRYGGLNRVYLEKINGVYQGCAMRFTQGLEAGPNRIFFGPDGSLYVGGIGGRHGSTWSWQDPKTGKPKYGGLELLTTSIEAIFVLDHMPIPKGGFRLTL